MWMDGDDRVVVAPATGQPDELDIRVPRQEADELGADISGRADDPDPDAARAAARVDPALRSRQAAASRGRGGGRAGLGRRHGTHDYTRRCITMQGAWPIRGPPVNPNSITRNSVISSDDTATERPSRRRTEDPPDADRRPRRRRRPPAEGADDRPARPSLRCRRLRDPPGDRVRDGDAVARGARAALDRRGCRVRAAVLDLRCDLAPDRPGARTAQGRARARVPAALRAGPRVR